MPATTSELRGAAQLATSAYSASRSWGQLCSVVGLFPANATMANSSGLNTVTINVGALSNAVVVAGTPTADDATAVTCTSSSL